MSETNQSSEPQALANSQKSNTQDPTTSSKSASSPAGSVTTPNQGSDGTAKQDNTNSTGMVSTQLRIAKIPN